MGYMFLEHLTEAAEEEAKRDAAWLAFDKQQHAEFMGSFAEIRKELATQSLSLKDLKREHSALHPLLQNQAHWLGVVQGRLEEK